VVGDGTVRKSVCDFLYRLSMVTFPLFTRFRDIAAYVLQHHFPHPIGSLLKISPCSPGSRWVAFGLRRMKVLGSLSVQLASKISNLCDPDPPTSQSQT